MKDHSDWVSNKRKPWARMDAGEWQPTPQTIRIRPENALKMALNYHQNGRPIHVPYAWNGAERYRMMGIAMSLFTVRQRIRAAQRAMQETVTWPSR